MAVEENSRNAVSIRQLLQLRKPSEIFIGTLKKSKRLTTEEIIQKLRRFGVDFKEEQFQKDVKNFYSVCELANHWGKKIYSYSQMVRFRFYLDGMCRFMEMISS